MKNRLKSIIQEAIDSEDIVGASILVRQNDKEICYAESGHADCKLKTPFRRDTICKLYSMTKPITGAAVITLMEQGAFDLFDPVSKYLPGFKNQKVVVDNKLVPANREVLIVDLLSMTAGYGYGDTETVAGKGIQSIWDEVYRKLDTNDEIGTVELANLFGQSPLSYHPGTHWSYGVCADILGALIEVVTKMSFGEYLKKTFFEPLQMPDTGFYLPVEMLGRLATPYMSGEGGTGIEQYIGNHLGIRDDFDRQPAFESGGAGLCSTADDFAKFGQMLLNRGEYNSKRIMSPATVDYFTTRKLEATTQSDAEGWPGFSGYTYGNLMRIMTDPTRCSWIGSKGEYGWDGWLGSYFCNSPADQLTIIIMVQKIGAGNGSFEHKLRNHVFSQLKR